jgi:hypothetical protein
MAAETPDPSTAIPAANSDELLLVDVHDLVAQACKSPDEAEKLIIEFANRGGFTHVHSTGDYIDPRHWGRRHEGLGSFTPVDFDNSMVRYIRLPADQAGSYLLRQQIDELLRKDFPSRPYKEMRLVRLWRSEALALLRWAGLPLPTQQIAPVNDPAVATSAVSALAATAASNPPASEPRPFPKSIAKKLAGKREMLLAALALQQEFPPDGKTPRSMTNKECKERLSKHRAVSLETLRRVRNLLGRTAN